jgi:dihydroxyacetone kinase
LCPEPSRHGVDSLGEEQMTRIFNDPADFKDEMTSGFVSAYARYVEKVPGASGVMRVGGARHGKVSLVIGGGSGHYPAFCGSWGRDWPTALSWAISGHGG